MILRIQCDGGLGNRYGALVSGLVMAERMGATALAHWPVNANCGASLGDLYASLPFEWSSDLPKVDWPVMAHMDWAGRDCHRISDESMALLAGRDIEFASDRLIGTAEQAREWLARCVVQPAITQHIEDFCIGHRITTRVRGIHMRRTDNGSRDEERHLYNLISNDQVRYFVCSDDIEFERELMQFPNVIIHPKKHAVEKLQEGGWRITPPADNPTACYNVRRSREQVIEAFQDMRILARTTFDCTRSTFCKWARHQ